METRLYFSGSFLLPANQYSLRNTANIMFRWFSLFELSDFFCLFTTASSSHIANEYRSRAALWYLTTCGLRKLSHIYPVGGCNFLNTSVGFCRRSDCSTDGSDVNAVRQRHRNNNPFPLLFS